MSATQDPIARPSPALRNVLSNAFAAVAARIRAPGSNRSHPVLVPVLGSIAVAAAITVAALLVVANLRDRTIADSGRGLRNTALVLAAQTDRAFQALELVESGVIERMQFLGIATPDDFDRRLGEFGMHELLAGRIASLPHVDAVSLINAEGRLINFSRSWPAPVNDLSDRDYFIALKSNPQLTSFISQPLRNRGSGTWVICLARKVTAASGEFLGLIVGSMQLKSFEDFFKTIALGDDGSIALFRRDGMLLARHPHVEPWIGRSNVSGAASFESDLAQSNHAIRRMTSPIDQQDRLIAAASLTHYPVVVAVTRTVTALLADWQQQARYLAGLTVTLVVVIAGICAAMVRRFRDQSVRLDAALNNMGQGLAMFDSQLRLVVVNRSYCELYRLPPEAVTPGRTLRQLIALRSAAGTSPADAEQIHRTTEARLAAGGPWNAIWDMPDGRTIAVSNVPMTNGGWLATHEDITERRRAEREILARQAEVERLNAQFAIALSNMAQGLSMYDSDMRLIVCNARYAEIFGIPPELTRPGTPYHAIVAGRTAETTSSDEIVADMAHNRGTARIFTREFVDGRIIAVSHQPLADGGFVGVHEDITARRHAERETLERKAELERVNAQLDVALSNMTHGLCMYDGDMRLTVCNASYAEIYGIPLELTKPGTPYRQICASCVPETVPLEEIVADMAHRRHVAGSVVRELADGRIIAVTHRPLADGGFVAVHEDVTARKRAERETLERKAELERVNAHLDVALSNMTHGLCMYDGDMRLIVCNARYAQMYAIPDELTKPGTPYSQLVTCTPLRDISTEQHFAETARHMDEERSFTRQLRDGRIIAASHRPLASGGWVGVHEDVTERKQAEARIEHMARHDALTGLPNRAAFTEKLAAFRRRAEEENGRFAVLCLDLDRFKEVNDVFGHGTGDSLLCEVSRRLAAAANGAFLARLGGDEFVVLSAQEPQPATTEALAERLQAALAGGLVVEGQELLVGLSIGVAIFPGDGDDPGTILANADAALYRAKADGRGGIRFFDASMDQRLRDCRALQHDLRSAAERGEIVIHYQPQARIGGEIVGFEALVRWLHPVRGMIAPSAFISVAEESGLIVPLGEWILRETCREAASWARPLAVSVNLSPVQFRRGDLAASVHAILLETGLAPGRLELEITEGVLIGDFSRAVSILGRLKALGVKIAMDDFGTGYSSLSYLQTFPFDKIKIDRSFVSNVQSNPQSATIIRAVIGLGRGLNLPIIAEGVETQGELDFLADEACDEVQGYLVGRPAPIAHYAKLVGREPEPVAPARFAAAG
jgi:diguanylate cyclase (GGDEF)-like protein